MDKVKPLKLEHPSSGGTETNRYPTETDPDEDYISTKGIAFEGLDTLTTDVQSGNIGWTDANSSGFRAHNTPYDDYLDRLNGLGFVEIYNDGAQGPFILKFDHLIVQNDSTLENVSLIGIQI